MNKQIIFENKVKLIDFVFQNSYRTINNTETVLDSMMVINDSKNLNFGSLKLNKTTDLTYKTIGTMNTGYSLVEIVSNFPIILNFAVEEKEITLITSSFSYNNSITKLTNIQVLNSSLLKDIDTNTYYSVESSRDIDLKFILIESYDLKYTTFGEYHV
jgi:hypothetical protein